MSPARIEELAEKYGLQVNPKAIISKLAVGQRQRVEIVKALYRGAALLVLDEPTAVLTPQEVDDIFVIFRQMAADGHALIFISHKLDEIFALTDRVSVLRDGRMIGTVNTADVNQERSSQHDGRARSVAGHAIAHRSERGEVRLILENVNAVNEDGKLILKDFSLEVHSGEIVGVAGISGNGQRPLARTIAGLRASRQLAKSGSTGLTSPTSPQLTCTTLVCHTFLKSVCTMALSRIFQSQKI